MRFGNILIAMARLNFDKTNYLLAVLGLAGLAIAWISTSKLGIGLSSDSIHYIHAARSLMDGNGFQAFGGGYYVGWPPLFPSILALLGKLGVEPINGARLLNGFCYGLTIYFFGHLLLRHLKSSVISLFALSICLISLTLIRVSIMAWSEALFILLTIMFLSSLTRFIQGQRTTLLLVAATCASLAALDRYIGITLGISGVVSILILLPDKGWRWRVNRAAAFGVISTMPLLAWLIRNQLVSDSFAGSRPEPESGLTTNLVNTAVELSSWLAPAQYISTSLGHWLLVALGLTALVALYTTLVWCKYMRGAKEELLKLLPVSIFVLIYTGMLIFTASISGFDPIGGRLLAPVYVFVLLLIAVAFEEIWELTGRRTFRNLAPKWVWPVFGGTLIFTAILFVVAPIDKLSCAASDQSATYLQFLCTSKTELKAYAHTIIWTCSILVLVLGVAVLGLRHKSYIGRLAITGIFSIWLLYPVMQTWIYVQSKIEYGAGGFNTSEWRESPLFVYLEENPLNGKIYSNAPQIVYILTMTNNTNSPSVIPDSITEIDEQSQHPSYLIWIEPGGPLQSQQFQETERRFDLAKTELFSNGGIFTVKR